MKTTISIIVALVVFSITGAGCSSRKMPERFEINSKSIKINEAQSFFNDFAVHDNHVYFKCTLNIINNSSEKKRFTLEGDFGVDKAQGLVTESTLLAYDDSYINNVFLIKENSDELFEVYFIGEHGDFKEKNDRLLPKIVLNEIE